MSKAGNKPSKLSPGSLQVQEEIARWIAKLSIHFNQPQDEEQIKIFMHALRDNSVWQIGVAFSRCLNNCQFFPRLKQVHEYMPEERFPEGRRDYIAQKPILDVIRPFADEVSRQRFNCPLEALRTVEDAEKIRQAYYHGNRLRYERMGLDMRKWPKD